MQKPARMLAAIFASTVFVHAQTWIVNPANGHYYALTQRHSWTAAEAEAQSNGGHLVTIRSQAEQDWLVTNFVTSNQHPWIGLTDQFSTGSWVWVGGEPVVYLNWDQSEPGGPPEHWALLHGWYGGRWHDADVNGSNLGHQPGIIEFIPPNVSASYVTYRQSCPGSAGTPTLSLVHPPRVGQVFQLQITGLRPNSYGFLCFTLDDRWWIQNPNLPLPIDLIVVGAPGCFVNVDTAHRNATMMTLIDLAGNGTIDVRVGVPISPLVMGFQFYNQFISLDPTVNALGLVTTNAGRGVVGL